MGMTTAFGETSFGSAAHVWNSDRKEFINSDHERLATILSDYNPNFALVYIPERDRVTPDDHEKPFAILDQSPGRAPYIIKYITPRELQNPEAIISWVFKNDMSKNDVWANFQAEERAREVWKKKAEWDEKEERLDFLSTVMASKRHTYRLGGGRKIEK